MASVASAHDRVFRSALSNLSVAREFFAQHLPQNILKATDLNSLVLCPQSYIDEELKLMQSDVLYKAEIAGKEGYLFLLCEHQSKPDSLMPFRCLKYQIAIWDEHIKQTGNKDLPLIVTTVFYNGREPYTYSTDFRNLLNAPKALIDEIWGKPFRLVDVHKIPDEELRQYKWSGVLSFFMKHIFSRDFIPYLKEIMQQLKLLETEANGTEYIVSLLNYALKAGETENLEHFVEAVKSGLSVETGEKVMTIAEQLIERGMQQGIQQGMQQGLQQGALDGEKAVLKRLIKRRFGLIIPSEYLVKIEKADEDSLLHWSEKLLDAKTIDEVFTFYR